jgi:formamidopyrimidine-DNA glycosylase
MSNGSTVVFNDPRRFGAMWLFDDAEDVTSPTGALGPEPLDDAFVAEVLAEKLRGRRAPLKTALSDQRVIAGLGNIYVSEALHRARLSPLRAGGTLVAPSGNPRPPLRRLVHSIRAILNEAIADERHEYRFLRVYDREGERCPRRGCRGTVKRIVQAGRSTFFCPACQR